MSGDWEMCSARLKFEEAYGEGRTLDAELDAMLKDLCDWDDGPLRALEYWVAGDWTEEDYRIALARFKAKWFQRGPEERVAFYQGLLQRRCDEFKAELALRAEGGDDGR